MFSGGGEDREQRPHQPEGGGTGRVRGPVQNQETHTPQQAHEGLLRETGEIITTHTLTHSASQLQGATTYRPYSILKSWQHILELMCKI